MFLSIIPSWWHGVTFRAELDKYLVIATQEYYCRTDWNENPCLVVERRFHRTERDHQSPWLVSNKELGLINIIFPLTPLPSKSHVSKILTFWLRLDSWGSSNFLRRSFLGFDSGFWVPSGKCDTDSCPNRFAWHLWSCSLPSHFCLHAEPFLHQWHIPLNFWSGGQLPCCSGGGWLPISGKKDPLHICMHTCTHIDTPWASEYVTSLSYAPTMSFQNSSFIFD